MADKTKAEELKSLLETKGVRSAFFYGSGGVSGLKLSLEQAEKLLALLDK
jgi:hypothetical protein